jgi:hypothetical protein
MIASAAPPPLLSSVWQWIKGCRERDTLVLEAALAGQALLWGAWVWNPQRDAFASLPEAYTLLSAVPEWLVGGAFALHGLAHSLALAPPLRRTRYRKQAVLVAAALWSIVFVNMMYAVPETPEPTTYGGFILMAAWAHWSLTWRTGA